MKEDRGDAGHGVFNNLLEEVKNRPCDRPDGVVPL